MSDYERSYEIVDLDNNDMTFYSENETEIMFCCPFCIEKRGKPDNDGKLWFSKQKLVGHCFKCNTVIFPLIDTETEKGAVTRFKQIIDITLNKISRRETKEPSSIEFNFKNLSKKDLDYLKSRHIFLPIIANKLGLKSFSDNKTGIVIPYYYKDYVATFQVRFDTNDKKRRYYIPSGSDKILYSPDGIFKNFKLNVEPAITICEGAFSSIAARILGYPNPISVQGSSIKSDNINLIRKLLPENAFILMDSYDISKAVQNDLKKVPTLGNTKIISFGNDIDPEDFLKKEILDLNKKEQLFKNVIEFLKQP